MIIDDIYDVDPQSIDIHEKRLKLMIVGPENVGKSTLMKMIKRYLGNPTLPFREVQSEDLSQTKNGIYMEDFHYITNEQKFINLTICDFSGRADYHPMHSFYMGTRSVYIVVWNMRALIKNSRVHYWLSSIKYHAPDSDIILVATHDENISKKTKQNTIRQYEELRDEFQNICGFFITSLKKGYGTAEMLGAITERISNQIWLNESVDLSVLILEKVLSNLKTKKHMSNFPPIISGEDFVNIAIKCKIPEESAIESARVLQSFGRIFPQINEKENSISLVLLDTQWITRLFTKIIEKKNYIENGIILLEVISNQALIPLNIPSDMHHNLIRLLEQFEVVRLIPNTDQVLIPSQLPLRCENLQSVWPAYNPGFNEFLRLYKCDFIQDGFFGRLLVRLSKEYGYIRIWAHGIIFQKLSSMAYVEIEPIKKDIILWCRGQVKGKYPVEIFNELSELLEAILQHEFNISSEICSPCPTCYKMRLNSPTLFSHEEIERACASDDNVLQCTKVPNDVHLVPVFSLAPDLSMIDFDSHQVDLEHEVEFTDRVGEGAFADVFRGRYKDNDVAVKILKASAGTDTAIHNEFRHEVRIMRGLKHPNLVQLIGYAVKPKRALIIEYAAFGSLFGLIHENPLEIPPVLMYRIVYDIANGMYFLHTVDPPIVHRDFKSPNIMVNSLNVRDLSVAKIADFGLSKSLLTENFNEGERIVDNPTWLAPEVMMNESFGTPADVYPFGVVCWELLARDLPFSEVKFTSRREKLILDGQRPDIPDCHPLYNNLISRCWAQKPGKRPTFNHIFNIMIPELIQTDNPELWNIILSYTSNRRSMFTESVEVEDFEDALLPGTSEDLMFRIAPELLGSKKKMKIRFLTNQILVAPYPSNNSEVMIYNSFLQMHAINCHKIYNLHDARYNYAAMSGPVAEYYVSTLKPNLQLIIECVEDMISYLNEHPDNKILIQGDDKKNENAALVACACLVYNSQFPPAEAIEFYESKINVINSPTVKRYVKYFNLAMIEGFSSQQRVLSLDFIRLSSIPNFKITGGCDPWFCIRQNMQEVYFSKRIKVSKKKKDVKFNCKELLLAGDISITFYHDSAKKHMFTLSFNVNYENFNNELVFLKEEMEKANLDNKRFKPDFTATLNLLTVEQLSKQRSENYRSLSLSKVSLSQRNSSQDNYKCGVCFKEIDKRDSSLTIGLGLPAHYECLECSICKMNISASNETPVFNNKQVYCSKCDTAFFKICTACNQKIISQNGHHYDELSWHDQCFNYINCSMNLHSKEHSFFYSSPYCSTCGMVHQNNIEAQDVKKKKLHQDILDEYKTLLSHYELKKFFFDYMKRCDLVNMMQLCHSLKKRMRIMDRNERLEYDKKMLQIFLHSSGTQYVPLDQDVLSDTAKKIKLGGALNSLEDYCYSILERKLQEFPLSKEFNEYKKYFSAIEEPKELERPPPSRKLPSPPSVDSPKPPRRLPQIPHTLTPSKREPNITNRSQKKRNSVPRKTFRGSFFAIPNESQPLCVKCRENISEQTYMMFNNMPVHNACSVFNHSVVLTMYRCKICNIFLGAVDCVSIDGEWYCLDKCAPLVCDKCSDCKEPIMGEHCVYRGMKFHYNCFRCRSCQKVLTGRFYTDDIGRICIECEAMG
eukprot:TRINITY_DN5160_c0_g1_i1.p1 TRINITY_DN5160_c0_g1~~TRINITY_DN5160_c0_g1_i1.p1  ORF type:complete len:1628 (-),score=299.40 TRINITY_DN5160_c0_g1_i1:54-4937(-)